MTDLSKLDFTTRDTYLAWRAEWRATYAALTQTIRASKRKVPNWYSSASNTKRVV